MLLVKLKQQLYALPMEEIGKYDWEKWKMLHPEMKMFKLSDKCLRLQNCCIKNKD